MPTDKIVDISDRPRYESMADMVLRNLKAAFYLGLALVIAVSFAAGYLAGRASH